MDLHYCCRPSAEERLLNRAQQLEFENSWPQVANRDKGGGRRMTCSGNNKSVSKDIIVAFCRWPISGLTSSLVFDRTIARHNQDRSTACLPIRLETFISFWMFCGRQH